MKQVFLDTNVIIDYLGNRTGFYDDAAIIMSLAINQKTELHAQPYLLRLQASKLELRKIFWKIL